MTTTDFWLVCPLPFVDSLKARLTQEFGPKIGEKKWSIGTTINGCVLKFQQFKCNPEIASKIRQKYIEFLTEKLIVKHEEFEKLDFGNWVNS